MDELSELRRVSFIKDSKEQIRELLKLAEQECTGAQEMIGKFYYEGSGGLEKDVNKALEYFKKAADQGEEYSQYMVWSVTAEIDTTTSYDENSYAFRNLVKSADAGYASAIAFVSYAYAFGNMDIVSGKNWHIEISKSKAEHYLKKLYEVLESNNDSTLAQAAVAIQEKLDKELDDISPNESTDVNEYMDNLQANIRDTNVKSIIGLVLGIISLFGIRWLAIPGVIISKVAKDKEESISTVALVVNIIAVILLVIYII